MKSKLRVGVTGIGWCGSEHIKAFLKHPDCEVAWLHGRDRTRVEASLKKYDVPCLHAKITDRFSDLLNDPALDIVSIATPNSWHAAQAIAAARAGKHLLLEKPVAMSEADLTGLESAVNEAGVKTVTSFVLYWNALFKVARWLIESGRTGKILFVRTNYHSRVPAVYSGQEWVRTASGGGSHLLAAGCHAVDAVRQFCGGLPRSVTAFAQTGLQLGYEYPTTIHVNVRFSNGALGQISSSAETASPYHFGLEIYAEKLSIVNQFIRWPDDIRVSADELKSECPIPAAGFHTETYNGKQEQIRIECVLPNVVDVAHHPFSEEASSLVEAIRTGSSTPLPLEQAAITHRICFAADRSAAAGGNPVVFPPEESRRQTGDESHGVATGA